MTDNPKNLNGTITNMAALRRGLINSRAEPMECDETPTHNTERIVVTIRSQDSVVLRVQKNAPLHGHYKAYVRYKGQTKTFEFVSTQHHAGFCYTRPADPRGKPVPFRSATNYLMSKALRCFGLHTSQKPSFEWITPQGPFIFNYTPAKLWGE